MTPSTRRLLAISAFVLGIVLASASVFTAAPNNPAGLIGGMVLWFSGLFTDRGPDEYGDHDTLT